MYATNLRCLDCGNLLPMIYAYKCPMCDGALDVVYDYRQLSEVKDIKSIFTKVGTDILRYAPLLPLTNPDTMITLGEGGTKLLQMNNIQRTKNMPSIFLKNETSNSTGSFKDRPLSISVSKAREVGHKTLVIASSGNAGAAAAAYAAKGRLRCVVLVPAKTPIAKITQTIAYGAQVVRVNGSFSDCYQLAMHISLIRDCANVTTTYLNPFNLEGDKTIAYEIFTQLGSLVPDCIIVPIGAGPLLTGIHKGFQELNTLGLCNKLPAMVGVQAEGCAPIVKAFETGRKYAEVWGEVKTISSAIADPLHGYERDSTYTLNRIRESKGKAVSVSDEETLEACSELARCEGLFLEPSAATTLAAADTLIREGWLHKDNVVVLVLTGHGLKDSGHSINLKGETIAIEPDLQQLEKILL